MGSTNVISENETRFSDREQAAQMLSTQLVEYKDRENLIVIGIPRGGVVLAVKLAINLNAEVDIVLTRKITAPNNPDLAIGAVSEDGRYYVNESIVKTNGISRRYIDEEKACQFDGIKHAKLRYREVLKKKPLNDRVVILTDDGAATGATMQAAIWTSIAEFPRKIILALPVAPSHRLVQLAKDVDETVCLCAPSRFYAISHFYTCFEKVTDDQIVDLLKEQSSVAKPY